MQHIIASLRLTTDSTVLTIVEAETPQLALQKAANWILANEEWHKKATEPAHDPYTEDSWEIRLKDLEGNDATILTTCTPKAWDGIE